MAALVNSSGMIPPTFSPINDVDMLDRLVEQSHQAPVLLFLHAPHCPIGLTAFHEMARLDAEDPVMVIEVAHQRAISRAVEQRTGVRHESPQVIVLRGGEAVWDASHYDITTETVSEALRAAA